MSSRKGRRSGEAGQGRMLIEARLEQVAAHNAKRDLTSIARST
jgi:hypothetical protein